LSCGNRGCCPPEEEEEEPVESGATESGATTPTQPPPPPPPPPAPPSFFDPSLRGIGRTASIASLWVGLITYIAIGAPGKDEVSSALDADLLASLIANPLDPSVPPFFCVLFNLMGIWPAWYASVLLPGSQDQKPLPCAPFLVASVAVGMFALSPYLALREYRGDPDSEAQGKGGGSPALSKPPSSSTLAKEEEEVVGSGGGFVGRWFESRPSAFLLFASTAGLFAYGLQGDVAASFSEFKDLFSKELFPHATTLDFTALWLLSYPVMVEDMRRRRMDTAIALIFCVVPVLGHCAYLVARPPLPQSTPAPEL